MGIKRVNVFTITPGSQPPLPAADSANIVYDIQRNSLSAVVRGGLVPIVSQATMVNRLTTTPTGTTDSLGTEGSVTWDDNIFFWKTSGRWFRLTGLTFNSVATLTTKVINDNYNLTATSGGIITDDGGFAITQKGVVWSLSATPTLSDSFTTEGSGSTSYDSIIDNLDPFDPVYVRAYATNSAGTGYGNQLSFEPNICLAAGTRILLADNTHKNIEDVTHDDVLKVWNFDLGRFDQARPLWIKQAETADSFNLLTFSDGSTLKTINQHRIFNYEKGLFTHPMTEETPVGTTTFNEAGEIIHLVSKEVVQEEVIYHNVITEYHINVFSNGVLTSCRFNNIYPISKMKFVNDHRAPRAREEFSVPDQYFHGLRLSEQTFQAREVESYVRRLERKKVELVAL